MASNSESSWNLTFISFACSITWLFVTIYPVGSITKPDPSAWGLSCSGCCCGPCWGPNGKPGGKFLKKSLNWGGILSKGTWFSCFFGFWTVKTFTTDGDNFSTRLAKSSDSGCAWGFSDTKKLIRNKRKKKKKFFFDLKTLNFLVRHQ